MQCSVCRSAVQCSAVQCSAVQCKEVIRGGATSLVLPKSGSRLNTRNTALGSGKHLENVILDKLAWD